MSTLHQQLCRMLARPGVIHSLGAHDVMTALLLAAWVRDGRVDGLSGDSLIGFDQVKELLEVERYLAEGEAAGEE